ncbi:MAG: acetoacetate--CoA ligase [Actinomycetota bacterium]
MSQAALLWSPTSPGESAMYKFLIQTKKFHGGDSTTELYRWSIEKPEEFWGELWDFLEVIGERGQRALLPDPLPKATFFPDAKVSYLENLLAPKSGVTVVAEADLTNIGSRVTHEELVSNIERVVQLFQSAGVVEGDRVVSILPIGFEVLSFLLAGFESGAIVAGASPEFGDSAIISRFSQLQPKVLIATTQYQWNGKIFDRRETVEKVLHEIPSITHLILVGDGEIALPDWVSVHRWNSLKEGDDLQLTRREFDQPAYVLFTSGTTGVPKGLVHRSGGVMLKHLMEQKLHCDIRPGDRVCFYSTTGWMMWNWSISILGTGAELVLFDGSPNYPDVLRLFHFASAQKLTHLGLSARLLDVIKESGRSIREVGDLSALRTIMVTGSPLSASNATWLSNEFDGRIFLSPFSGGTDIAGSFTGPDPLRPYYAGEMQGPLLGMDVDVFDEMGNSLGAEEMGELVCKRPFPSVPLGIWGDSDNSRFISTYFHTWPGVWVHGDLTSKTERGGIIIHGRSDATLNISGVRIGTSEIYSALDGLNEVTGALAVAQPWDGDQRIVLFVVATDTSERFTDKVKQVIRAKTSPRHVPGAIFYVGDLPRTFNGKLAEVAVADLANGRPVRNLASLANPESLDEIGKFFLTS